MAVKALMTDETGKQIVDAIREKAGLEARVSDLEKNKVDKSSIAQTTGSAEDKVMSQKTATEELEKKFDKSNVVQSTGDAEDKVMSQAAATKEFGKLSEEIGEHETAIETLKAVPYKWFEGYYVSASTGELSESDQYKCTSYIPLKSGDVFTPIYYDIQAPNTTGIILFDENKRYLGAIAGDSTSLSELSGVVKEDSGASFLRAATFKAYNATLRYTNASGAVNHNIGDGVITAQKTSFVEKKSSANLYDYHTMSRSGMWAYCHPSEIGGLVNIESNQYTGSYTAIKIDVPHGAEHISLIGENIGTHYPYIFSYYFADGDSFCITYEYNVKYFLHHGKTLNVPSGAKYLYITTYQYPEAVWDITSVMISATEKPIPYVPYEKWIEIPELRIPTNENKTSLALPEQYELVVGDTFELFYKGFVNAAHYECFDVVVTCAKGKAYSRKYVFTPTSADVGTTKLTVELYDQNHNLLDTADVNLIIKEKATSPSSERTILYVGDSLANGGHVPGEFKRRLISTDGNPVGDGLSNIRFIGTCNNGYVDYEGYGGWTFNSYNTEYKTNAFMWITVSNHGKTEASDQHSTYKDSNGAHWKLETIEPTRIKIIRTSGSSALPSTGSLTWVSGGTNQSDIVYTISEMAAGNPFWNESTGAVDFANYVSARGATSLDYVYVLLGWNGVSSSEETQKANARTFINNILNDFPNCKIVLLGLEIPARDGLAENYGASGTLAHYYDCINYVFRLNQWYTDITQEESYVGKVSFVNVAGQFDTEYNMSTSQMNANTRNTTKITYQSNGVHPAYSGYMQIADACWRDFHHKQQG